MQNCEYINDNHITLLIDMLKHDNCNIRCINIGELSLSIKCWEDFTNLLCDTKVKHMYKSESIGKTLNNIMMNSIRKSREKYDKYKSIDNIKVRKKIAHYWWYVFLMYTILLHVIVSLKIQI